MDKDKFRPQVHCSSPENWMNDPNGMVYFDGLYHLFYQHHPYSNNWGPMHWGHVVSRDLMRWEHRPIALAPDELGQIWSGSAIYDEHNTSGLGTSECGPLVAIFTYHCDNQERTGLGNHQTQGLAYSNDGGSSWHKYAGNPVLDNPDCSPDFRDPKVFWHAGSTQWVMVLAVGDECQFWGSPNLLDWRYLSCFGAGIGAHGGVWECPDLIQVPIEGRGLQRWVLIQSVNPGGPQRGSGTQYFVGDFDGTTFAIDSSTKSDVCWIDQGPDCYAGVCWSNLPVDDGRVVFLGWLGNWEYASQVPTEEWRGVMCIPRSLTLRETSQGQVLCSWPVTEVAACRSAELVRVHEQLTPGNELVLLEDRVLTPVDLEFSLTLPDHGLIELRFSNALGDVYAFGYDVDRQAAYSDRIDAGQSDFSPREFPRRHWVRHTQRQLDVRMLLDSCSVEVFLAQGEVAFTALIFPHAPYDRLSVIAVGSGCIIELVAHRLSVKTSSI